VKDTLVIAAVFATLFACAAFSKAPLEAMADPSDATYIPRPEWYFLGLFQLLKYFPGKLEPVGAIGIPTLIIALLFLLPLFDPEPERDPRARPRVSAIVTLVVMAVSTLTWLGFRDTPKERNEALWEPRAIAGLDLASSARCTACHVSGGAGPDLNRGRIARDDQWIQGHLSDPAMIAAGLRPPPPDALKTLEAKAVLAYVKKIRAGAPPPQIAPEDRLASDVFGTKCIQCHVIDGDGGREGPDLTHAGNKPGHDAAWFERWITDPAAVKPDAEMPAFAGKLSDAEMKAIARYLANRK
jgi:ubiquinol-cytochrome c reductase cytochrome b subunit